MADSGTSSTIDRRTLFSEILRILQPEGVDPASIDYYVNNEAQPGEWANIIAQAFKRLPAGSAERKQFIDTLSTAGFFKATDDLNYWYNADETNALDIKDLENAAEQRLPGMLGGQGGGVSTTTGGPNEDIATGKVGGVGANTVSIKTSKSMQWWFDPETAMWYVGYKLPNSTRYVFYEASPSDMDAIFGDGQRPTNYSEMTVGELGQQDGYTYGGSIVEVTGEGSYEAYVNRTIQLGLDEGKLPDWAAGDPAIMDIIFVAQAEDKSNEWVIEQIAKLPSFKQRFPGLESLEAVGLSTVEAVTAFLEFEGGVKELVARDGGDPSTVTAAEIGAMIGKGHSLTDVTEVFNYFDTLEKNSAALEAFNEILVARGLDPLGPDDQFEFISGNAPKELYDIWEETSLLRAAEEAGLSIDANAAISLAARTEGLTTYEAATEGLQLAASNLLRFRTEIGLDRYGINEQDLIDASLGLAPSSGISQSELARNMEKAINTARANRERQRANPYTAFTKEGVPAAASLTKLAAQE